MATRPRGMVKVGTRLYVSDSDQQGWANVVRVIDLESGRTTVAAGVGGGDAYSGDGGPATQANLADPGPLAADDAGNLYIADRRNARIRKVAPDGTITTVAGNGEIGCGGTGGPALSAQVAGISGLAVDRAGNLYISSAPCNVVRRVSPQGIITHFAGNPLLGPDGDGGPAAQANIGNPGTVAVDRSGNVFIEHHGRVRKVDEAGIISTFAGPGSWPPQLGDGGPATAANLHATSMAPDGKGNVYVTDVDFERVRKVDPDGVISTVAGTTGGYWEGVAIGEDGTVYASDIDGVWRFRDGQKALVAGLEDVWLRRTSGDGGPALDAQFAGVADVVGTPNGDVYVADLGNERVRRIAADGVVSTVAGGGHDYPVAGSTMPATAARLHPEWLAVGPEGDLYISSIGQVMRVNGLGVLTVVTGTTGGPVPALGITFDGAGNLYTSHKAEGKVIRRSPDGTVTTVVGCERWNGPSVTACVTMTMDGIPATEATLVEPSGIAVDAAGNLYIAETGLNRIRKVGSDGIITTVAGSSVRGFDPAPGPATERDLSSPRGLRVDATGAVYVADTGYGAIRRVDPDGTMTTVAGTGLNGFAGDGGPASDARLDTPGGLALRPDGSVLVADTRNHRVRLVGPGLSQVPAAPTGVRATGADGSAAVSWKAPAGNGGAAITGYSITASPGGKTVPAAAGATSAVVPGLDNGKRYTFTVRARNANGLGPESPPSKTAAPNRLRAMGWNGS
ncbi:MAG TPA: fibronectin type III domain-containing protein, partial [Acidimicrobiales bacterium]